MQVWWKTAVKLGCGNDNYINQHQIFNVIPILNTSMETIQKVNSSSSYSQAIIHDKLKNMLLK